LGMGHVAYSVRLGKAVVLVGAGTACGEGTPGLRNSQ